MNESKAGENQGENQSGNKGEERRYLFDNPSNIQRLLRVFYGICIVLLIADVILHRHVEHPLEALPGFYPVYGFVACVALVLVAKQMRKVLMKGEDYYDDQP